MKSFKSLALVFAAAVISFGSFAQTSNTAKPADKAAAKPVAKTAAPKKVDSKKSDVKTTAKPAAAKSTAPASK